MNEPQTLGKLTKKLAGDAQHWILTTEHPFVEWGYRLLEIPGNILGVIIWLGIVGMITTLLTIYFAKQAFFSFSLARKIAF